MPFFFSLKHQKYLLTIFLASQCAQIKQRTEIVKNWKTDLWPLCSLAVIHRSHRWLLHPHYGGSCACQVSVWCSLQVNAPHRYTWHCLHGWAPSLPRSTPSHGPSPPLCGRQRGHTHFYYYIKWQDDNHQKYITSVDDDLNIAKRGSRLVFRKDSKVKRTVICYLIQTFMVKILNTMSYSSSTWVTIIPFMVEMCTGQPERCQKHIIKLKTPQLCSRQSVLGCWSFLPL